MGCRAIILLTIKIAGDTLITTSNWNIYWAVIISWYTIVQSVNTERHILSTDSASKLTSFLAYRSGLTVNSNKRGCWHWRDKVRENEHHLALNWWIFAISKRCYTLSCLRALEGIRLRTSIVISQTFTFGFRTHSIFAKERYMLRAWIGSSTWYYLGALTLILSASPIRASDKGIWILIQAAIIKGLALFRPLHTFPISARYI